MLSFPDITVMVIYLSLVLFVGWRCSHENKTSEDYFMARRSLSWFPVAVSIAATTISANSFIGGPGWAYSEGLYPFMINIALPLAVAFVLCTTLPVCYHLRLTSVYEYVELRLGPGTRFLTVLGFFANALIQVGSMVFVPSLMISFFTGWPLSVVVPVVVVVTVLYTLMGGIRAVIWTDVCQMGVMWLSLCFIVYILLSGINLPFSELIHQARSMGKLDSLNFSMDISSSQTFWATLVGGFFMWLNYFGFNQVQIQRVLTSKSIGDAKRSFVNSAVITNVMYFVFMMIGVLLFLFFKGRPFENANAVMFHFISTHLGKGLVGLVVAGIFASAMSSVDSLFNSMTTVFTKDIYERYLTSDKGPVPLKTTMFISAIFGVIVTFVCLLGFSKSVESVLNVVGSYISYLSGPMAAIYILSFFVPCANDKGTVGGVVIGFTATLAFCSFVKVGWIWKPALGFIFTFFAALFFSLLFSSTDQDKKRQQYTLYGVLQQIKASENLSENGVSLLPLAIDRYALVAGLFFIGQYAFLWLLS